MSNHRQSVTFGFFGIQIVILLTVNLILKYKYKKNSYNSKNIIVYNYIEKIIK